jgi:hypothetical protein
MTVRFIRVGLTPRPLRPIYPNQQTSKLVRSLPLSDLGWTSHARFAPILLQNSFCEVGTQILRPVGAAIEY